MGDNKSQNNAEGLISIQDITFNANLFNQLFENSSNAIIIFEFKTHTYFLNECARQLFNIIGTKNEFKKIGKKLAKVNDQDLFKELIISPDIKNFNKYSQFESEICLDLYDKQYIHWNTNLIYRNNEPTYIYLSGTNITDRHIAEITLRESFERIDLIINSAKDVVYILDKKQRFIEIYGDWSYEGISKETFIGKTTIEIFGDNHHVHSEANNKALSGNDVVYEWSIDSIPKESVYIQTSLSPIKDKNEIIGLIGISRNITQKIKVEREIKLSHEYLDNSSDLIQWLNPDGSFNYVNKASYERLGYTKKELLSKNVWDIDLTIKKSNWNYFWERIKSTGKDSMETFHIHKNGTRIPVEISANYIKFSGVELVCASIRDVSARKHAEKALIENREKLNSTLTSMNDLVFVIDKKGIIIDYHRPPDNFGFFTTSKTFVGYNYKDVFPIHILKPLEKSLIRIEAGEIMIDFDYIIEIGKQKRWFNARISKYVDNEGEYDGIIVVSRDITRRKRIEQAIRESEEKFRIISDQSLMGIIIIQNGSLKYYNNAFSKQTGYPIEEIDRWAEDELFKIVYKEDLDLFINNYKQRLIEDKERVLNFIYRGITKNGDIQWMEQWSKIITYEGKKANLVTFINIDERKKAEHALTESETRLKLALEGAKEGLIDWNIKTGCVYFSKEWPEMLDYDPQEIKPVINSWFDIIYEKDKAKVDEVLANHMDGKTEFYQTEHRLKTKNGKWKWVLAHGKIVEYDANSKPVRAIGTQIDISNQKENEHKLKALNATKDKFFSIIAHDLKNPFNQFLGLSSLMLENFYSYTREELLDFIQLLYKISDKTNTLLENLLEWAMSQTGKISFAPKKINLKLLLANTNSLFENQLKTKKILLDDLSDPNVMILADENMIKSVYRNLLSNAIKYTPENGKIIISSNIKDNQVEISIKDSGVGISAENIDKLFKIDIQYTSEGTNNEKGTGLGLILCKEFIELNNGIMAVESSVGKGSTFSFTLPLASKIIQK